MMRTMMIGILLATASVVLVPVGSAGCGDLDVPCQIVCESEPKDGTGAVGCAVEQSPFLSPGQKQLYHDAANCVYDLNGAWGDCQ